MTKIILLHSVKSFYSIQTAVGKKLIREADNKNEEAKITTAIIPSI